MNCKNVNELRIEKKFERLTPTSKEEFEALENVILADGEIHNPIFIWQGQNTIVDGHSRHKILKKHPNLKHTIKEIHFEDWQEVIVWIVEHHVSRKSFTLWQRLEMGLNCEEYWKAKEEAKRNQGTRSDLKSPGDKKLEPIDSDLILAEKAGCKKTTVTMFKKVFKEASEAIKQRCREGDMSIKHAYQSIAKRKPPKEKPEVVVETVGDIFDECEKNQNLDEKSNINIPDPKLVTKRMEAKKVPDGAIWLAINPIDGLIQVFKKNLDQEKGTIHIHVGSYSCKAVSKEGVVTILEAHLIGGGTEDIVRKDDNGFDLEAKKAS